MSNGERQASLFGGAGDEPEEEPPRPGRGKDRRQDAFGQSGASALLHRRADQPLATRMRPASLEEVVGQSHLLAEGRALRRVIESDSLPSIILWGPPGSGKTTLAAVIAGTTRSHFVALSAVTAGVADLRRVVDEAAKLLAVAHRRTILFIDEIHRFSKSQQDAILPHVERGTVILIGATTENPSFEVNAALLSRCRVFALRALSDGDIHALLLRALSDTERGLGASSVDATEEALTFLANFANGDARTALGALEVAASITPVGANGKRVIDLPAAEDALQRRALLYDNAEEHYNIISALHKSLRGSDPDASLYWLARMLESGEDPLYIVRRLIRFASEDVGQADPQALLVCVAAQQAVHFIGMPEGALALAQAVLHLAAAPKSNAVYLAYEAALADVRVTRNDPVPLHLRNAPTQLMKDFDFGKDYKYAHDEYAGQPDPEDQRRPPPGRLQDYLPEAIRHHQYYLPGAQGDESSIQAWLSRRRRTGSDQ